MSDLIHVKGLAGLDMLMQEIPVKVEKNIARSALRAGAKVIQAQAKANIHSVSGVLASSLKIGTRARGGSVTANVSTKVFYAKFVEFGTRPHTISARDGGGLRFGGGFYRLVQHPGIVNPHPFLRPALDTQAQAAVIAVREQIRVRLTKEGIDIPDEGDQ